MLPTKQANDVPRESPRQPLPGILAYRIQGNNRSLLTVGRSLTAGEVKPYSEGHADVIAHAVATYSVAPTVAASGG